MKIFFLSCYTLLVSMTLKICHLREKKKKNHFEIFVVYLFVECYSELKIMNGKYLLSFVHLHVFIAFRIAILSCLIVSLYFVKQIECDFFFFFLCSDLITFFFTLVFFFGLSYLLHTHLIIYLKCVLFSC